MPLNFLNIFNDAHLIIAFIHQLDKRIPALIRRLLYGLDFLPCFFVFNLRCLRLHLLFKISLQPFVHPIDTVVFNQDVGKFNLILQKLLVFTRQNPMIKAYPFFGVTIFLNVPVQQALELKLLIHFHKYL